MTMTMQRSSNVSFFFVVFSTGGVLLQLLLLLSGGAGNIRSITVAASGYGIPGSTQTDSGYDTEMGVDAICWKSYGVEVNEEEHQDEMDFDSTESVHPDDPFGIHVSNPLFATFHLSQNGIQLLKACPPGNTLHATAPYAHTVGQRLRTLQEYNYSVSVSLNLTSLILASANNTNQSQTLLQQQYDNNPNNDMAFVSENKTNIVTVQVIACELGKSGFCSPFIHEEANARLESMNESTKVTRGDEHGGTHIHSGYVKVPVPLSAGPIYSFTVEVPMIVNHPGQFFVIAAVLMFLGEDQQVNNTVANLTRFDMSNALITDDRIIEYQAPVDVLSVSTGVLRLSYVCISLAATIISFLLYQTIKHRNHQVLMLTQGHFLIVYLLAALAATVCCFLMQPKNDTYCMLGAPFVLICLQLMYAVTVGRLWRINAVISPLLMKALRYEEGWPGKLRRLVQQLCCSWPFLKKDNANNSSNNIASHSFRAGPKKLRTEVSSTKLAIVIALVTLPQVIVQVVGMVVQPRTKTLDLNEDESKGREMCSNDSDVGKSILHYGFWLFLLLVVVLLGMAHATRKLPSLFNETAIIFNSTLSAVFMLILGVVIIAVTDSPTTTPAVEYVVWVALTLSITLNASVRIMLPKLQMVWRGETVLVSKLVSDHAESTRKDNELFRSQRQQQSSVATGSRQTSRVSSGNYPSTAHSNSIEVQDELEEFGMVDGLLPPLNRDDGDTPRPKMNNTEITSSMEDPVSEPLGEEQAAAAPRVLGDKGNSSSSFKRGTKLRFAPEPNSQRVDIPDGEATPVPQKRSRRRLSHRIIVKRNEAPARRLVLRMIDLQHQLGQVNDRVTSGLAVSEDDWLRLRRLSRKLGVTFTEEVDFEWESEESRELHLGEEVTQQNSTPNASATSNASTYAQRASNGVAPSMVPTRAASDFRLVSSSNGGGGANTIVPRSSSDFRLHASMVSPSPLVRTSPETTSHAVTPDVSAEGPAVQDASLDSPLVAEAATKTPPDPSHVPESSLDNTMTKALLDGGTGQLVSSTTAFTNLGQVDANFALSFPEEDQRAEI